MRYLYKSRLKDKHDKTVWRLNTKITPSEWKQVAHLFKYFSTSLKGWGTTHPLEVSEILTQTRGDKKTKTQLEKINKKIEKVEWSMAWGYENDWLGEIDKQKDLNLLQKYHNEKKALLKIY